ncbi:MAG: hypothetical protein N3E45_14240 [Oscillatoriaceae bacterium SKW80]|nr:hypothetical protein [Oscillatoriaceae bacterium SKW80]HIK29111.1 hypothetical protein [Oscillatoriaceae cyanobacterium M7585_C2015_266]
MKCLKILICNAEMEALLPPLPSAPLDPLEETAWIEGSYDAEFLPPEFL